MSDKPSHLTYGHDTHEAFNQRFEPKTPERDVTEPWIDHDKVPQVHRAFDTYRDPTIQTQTPDMEKTESQGRDSGMIEKDQPEFLLKPPAKIRDPVDREEFNHRWLLEERDAVLAQAATPIQSRDERSHERQPITKEPSR